MMPPGWWLDIASVTDRGRVRAQNEDSVAADPELCFAVLADGMGGCNAGEVASRIAVETVERGMREASREGRPEPGAAGSVERTVTSHVLSANAEIYRQAQADPAYRGMGTTLVMALWHGDSVVVAHVGDSRAYLMRGGALEPMTRDHSVRQEQIDRGLIDARQARHVASRNLVTRALGVDADVEVEVHTHRAQGGDLYLLCSDGLSDMLDEHAITAILLSGGRNVAHVADALVQQANAAGGRDNISVILARLHTAADRPPPGR